MGADDPHQLALIEIAPAGDSGTRTSLERFVYLINGPAVVVAFDGDLDMFSINRTVVGWLDGNCR